MTKRERTRATVGSRLVKHKDLSVLFDKEQKDLASRLVAEAGGEHGD